MTRLEACKLIISKMTKAGLKDIIPVEWVNSWDEEEIDYTLVNYGSWISPEDFTDYALYCKFMQENVH